MSRPHDRRPRSSPATERALWAAIYAVLVLAPLAFLAAAPEGEDSDDFLVPAALGFVAMTVLALQVVVPSRAAAFTAPFGVGRLVRFHRLAGLAAAALVAAHVVTAVGEEDDRLAWLHPIDAPLAGRLGLAAAVLLVLLTAAVLLRRILRTRYEVWRGLHVALGLGVLALSFGHVLAVARFSQVGTIRWLVLGFVVAALVAAFHLRVGRQFLAMRRRYRLSRSVAEPDGSITLELEALGHSGAPFAPGQFAWVKHAAAPYALTEHPFSYASSARFPQRPSFTVKPVGDFTSALADLAPGDELLVDGPHGTPALMGDGDCVLIVGGSGITPAMSVLRTVADEEDSRRLLLLYFVREPGKAALSGELEDLGRRDRMRVVVVPSRPPPGWEGPSGRPDRDLLDSLLPADRGRWSYFVCGPPGMTEATTSALDRLGIARAAVRVERYDLA